MNATNPAGDCCHSATAGSAREDHAAARAAATAPYFRPMCPGVESDAPGSCPKCGMALESALPVVLWCGWPLLARGWRSLVTRQLNMFTLIGLGVGVANGLSSVSVIGNALRLQNIRIKAR